MESNSSNSLRSRILEATRRIVIGDGYAALSMRSLAREIGCSATAIYLHFDGKDALIHSLIDEGMRRLNEVLTRAAQLEVEPVRRVESMLRAYVAFGLENPEYYEIMFMLHPRPLGRYPAENYRRARRNLDIIADVVFAASGQPPSADVGRRTATSVWSSVHGVVSLILAGRVDAAVSTESLVDEVVQRALSGLGLAAPSSAD